MPHHRRILLLGLATVLAAATACSDYDTDHRRTDPTRTASGSGTPGPFAGLPVVTRTKDPSPVRFGKALWSTADVKLDEAQTVSVQGEFTVIISRYDRAVAYRNDTGRRLWSYRTGDPLPGVADTTYSSYPEGTAVLDTKRGPVAVLGYRQERGSRTDRQGYAAISVRTGAVLWTRSFSWDLPEQRVFLTDASRDGIVVEKANDDSEGATPAAEASVSVLDPLTGHTRWSRTGFGVTGLAGNVLLVVGPGGRSGTVAEPVGRLSGLDLATGRSLWSRGATTASHYVFGVTTDRAFVDDEHVYAARTGRLVDRFRVDVNDCVADGRSTIACSLDDGGPARLLTSDGGTLRVGAVQLRQDTTLAAVRGPRIFLDSTEHGLLVADGSGTIRNADGPPEGFAAASDDVVVTSQQVGEHYVYRAYRVRG